MMEVRVADFNLRQPLRVALALLLFFLVGALPGYAQTTHDAVEKHDQEVRQSLKEAAKIESIYKDSHLNTEAYTFKKGEPGRRRQQKDGRDKYQFNINGDPVVKSKPFWKKKKYKPRSVKKKKREKRN